jgi:hypothetical protein
MRYSYPSSPDGYQALVTNHHRSATTGEHREILQMIHERPSVDLLQNSIPDGAPIYQGYPACHSPRRLAYSLHGWCARLGSLFGHRPCESPLSMLESMSRIPRAHDPWPCCVGQSRVLILDEVNFLAPRM